MKSSERKALDIFLCEYDYQLSFEQIISELTAVDYHNCDIDLWAPLRDLNPFALATIISEVESVLRTAIEGESNNANIDT